MNKRVVVTGLGVVAPNGVGIVEFENSLRQGISGIRFQERLKELKFSCQVAGEPQISQQMLEEYFTPLQLRGLNCSGIVYGVIAGKDAWKDAGLAAAEEVPDWESGIIFGTGLLGADKFREAIHLIDAGNTRRLGSTSVVQTMASGISAYLGGILGCGNQVTTNSSACTTGTESLLMGYDRIKYGKAIRMLVGSCSDSGPYIWGGFDAMRILPHKYNHRPTEASRPFSASACGFVPASGAGALVLEELDSALDRGATIYAEVMGGSINSGGQRQGGSMTRWAMVADLRRCVGCQTCTAACKHANATPPGVQWRRVLDLAFRDARSALDLRDDDAAVVLCGLGDWQDFGDQAFSFHGEIATGVGARRADQRAAGPDGDPPPPGQAPARA